MQHKIVLMLSFVETRHIITCEKEFITEIYKKKSLMLELLYFGGFKIKCLLREQHLCEKLNFSMKLVVGSLHCHSRA